MTDLVFREHLLPEDPVNIKRIVTSTGFFSDAEIEIAAELATERLNKGPESGYEFIFAENAGKTAGYICYGPIPATRFSYDLYWIAVDKKYFRNGIGHKLIQTCESSVLKKCGNRIYAETSGRDQYHPTRSFYRACGYKEVARLEDFYAPDDDKVIFLKVLS